MYNTQIATKNQINILLQEVKTLRSAVIGWVGKDSEGAYNPRFIKKILKVSTEKPMYSFKNKINFLQILKS